MEKHVRELRDYLADYGATNIHIEGGGKHQKLLFEYGGLERSLIVAHRPSTDHHAMENTKQALKRMLGPPIPLEEKQPRKLEDMMVELNTTVAPFTYVGTPPVVDPSKPSKTWKVWMCAYAMKELTQLYFYFPPEITQLFPDGVSIEQLDDEHWKLTKGGRSSFRKVYRRWKVCLNLQGIEPFGSIAAEAVEADGAILVYLSKEGRHPVGSHSKSVVSPHVAALTAKPPTSIPIPASLENQMRDIIRQIQAIEATCPYHLVRLEGGRIQWRAPIIE